MTAHGLPVYVALAPVELRFGDQRLWETSASGCKPFPVKPRFVVAFETALRPGTLNELSVPEHYTPGSDVLIITDEIERARLVREMPLTAEARAALDAAAPKAGLIGGKHDYREQLEKAARAADLAPRKAATLAPCDFQGWLWRDLKVPNLPNARSCPRK